MAKRNELQRAPVGALYIDHNGKKFTIHEACHETESDGYWYCCNHSEPFANQLQKDIHCAYGRHVLAWMCLRCGRAETP